MSKLFRRHSNILCFFCHTAVSPFPKNPRNFKCSTCGCWNRYDAGGEIISDEPAMHDEGLNKHSFARRASPRKDRFPTSYGPGPFCHACQTNQTLVLNLLSSYLPSPESPEYAQRIDSLPEYRESLHTRYPPVCDQCLPMVEEEIQKKDQMARTKALGAWLKDSKGKEKQRRVSGTQQEKEKVSSEMFWWKVRGVLWASTLASSVLFNVSAILGYRPLHFLKSLQPIFPLFTLASILWTAWDPTYASFRKAQRQGREVRVQGKGRYLVFQMIAWGARLLTSVLLWLSWYSSNRNYLRIGGSSSNLERVYFSLISIIEITAQAISFYYLRLKLPPAVRLIGLHTHHSASSRSSTPNPSSGSRGGTPALQQHYKGSSRQSSLQPASEPDLLAALSLSSKPIIPPKKPVFGLPSLVPNPGEGEEDLNDELDNNVQEEDAMDWTPTDPRASAASDSRKWKNRIGMKTNENVWLRPQRFFAPEKPTGLEGLFARTNLDDDAMMVDGQNGPAQPSIWIKTTLHLKRWRWIYVAVVIPIAVAVIAWHWRFLAISIARLSKSKSASAHPVASRQPRPY